MRQMANDVKIIFW